MIPFAVQVRLQLRGHVAPWVRRLVVLCACRLLLPWSRGLYHGHAVAFPDKEEMLMAVEIGDAVMLTYRNPGSLVMAGTAEAGTVERPERTCGRGVCNCQFDY